MPHFAKITWYGSHGASEKHYYFLIHLHNKWHRKTTGQKWIIALFIKENIPNTSTRQSEHFYIMCCRLMMENVLNIRIIIQKYAFFILYLVHFHITQPE